MVLVIHQNSDFTEFLLCDPQHDHPQYLHGLEASVPPSHQTQSLRHLQMDTDTHTRKEGDVSLEQGKEEKFEQDYICDPLREKVRTFRLKNSVTHNIVQMCNAR